jgi:hypothetical protein
MLRLQLAGVDSLLLSPLCRRCPQGRAGCCAAPPAIAWADIGRIVTLGGRDFLLLEMQAGRLLPSPRGLSILRVPANDEFPARCTYLGPSDQGCRLEPSHRSATCNYYLCDDAFLLAEEQADPLVAKARGAHDRIADFLGRCDLELSELVGATFPEGPSWDAAFLDWLALQFQSHLQKNHRSFKHLHRPT